MRKISVIGSTGSIGTQTLDIAGRESDRIKVTSLAAGSNVKLMEEQVRRFSPAFVSMGNEDAAKDLRDRIRDTDTAVCAGEDGLLRVASDPECDMVVAGIVGMIGIRPAIAAIESGKTLALANKETLVAAGSIITELARKNGVRILPVDSEHSAIFQSLEGQSRKNVEKIILTASGGTFRGMDRDALSKVTVKDALKNPNWVMGQKVTIDSASLVNKGLEVMEASWLFDVAPEDIEVVIHPQSILHSAVMYSDGAVIGQMGLPDMRMPISYALFYPERMTWNEAKLDLTTLGSMTFEKPDTDVFRGLPLAMRAAAAGGTMPAVFNAANEEAVSMFLKGKAGFLDIYDIISMAMDSHSVIAEPDLDDIFEAEREARECASSWSGK
ncbi:MAG: 1-deoxy-D-xylulose-5-phosphate reductoisomerase [Lachnospiraceae bacterium]|nr:1-deoxy-D-xylulose-5-phosphate reductoisomerase [Lachnospiraceae bacterium]